jgi:hypothetical protein
VVDTDGEVVTGDVSYPDDTHVQIAFLIPIAGTAHLT